MIRLRSSFSAHNIENDDGEQTLATKYRDTHRKSNHLENKNILYQYAMIIYL